VSGQYGVVCDVYGQYSVWCVMSMYSTVCGVWCLCTVQCVVCDVYGQYSVWYVMSMDSTMWCVMSMNSTVWCVMSTWRPRCSWSRRSSRTEVWRSLRCYWCWITWPPLYRNVNIHTDQRTDWVPGWQKVMHLAAERGLRMRKETRNLHPFDIHVSLIRCNADNDTKLT